MPILGSLDVLIPMISLKAFDALPHAQSVRVKKMIFIFSKGRWYVGVMNSGFVAQICH